MCKKDSGNLSKPKNVVISVAEFKAKAKKKSKKFKNESPEYKGIKFRSNLEVDVYKEIESLNHPFEYEQRIFTLMPSFKDTEGKTVQSIKHKPDFIIEIGDKTHIIEAKGFETKDFLLKLKLFKKVVLEENQNFVYHLVKNKTQAFALKVKLQNELRNLRQNTSVNPDKT